MREEAGGGSTTTAAPVSSGDNAPAKKAKRSRLPLIDALRAFASTLIAWHHFTFYPPFVTEARPITGDFLLWVRDNARVAQVFFVVSGYILSQMMAKKTWTLLCASGRFMVHRYLRLGLPYLAAIACAIVASYFARGWLPEQTAGLPPTWDQLLAHLFFLQDILGYEGLSAGLWFVCISMQLSLVFVAGLYLRDTIAGQSGNEVRGFLSHLPMAIGWAIAASTLFYFNRYDEWDMWFLYFFAQFFLGVIVYIALQRPEWRIWLVLYSLLFIAAMIYEWRSRLATSLLTGLLIYAGGKTGFIATWPKSNVIEWLGRTSYSLFLIHFPVFLVVATVFAHLAWTSPIMAIVGLFVSYFLSVAASAVFYRFVESPSAKLSHRFS